MDMSLIVDAIVAVVVIVAAVGGWRQGALTSVLAAVGVVAGLLVAAGGAPLVMQLTDSVALRFALCVAVVILLVAVGNLVGGLIGSTLRHRIKMRSSLKLDSAVGSFFQAVAALLVMWLVSIPLATGLSGAAAAGLQGSRILGAMDELSPPIAKQVPSKVAAMLNESGLPPLISPFARQTAPEVAAPNITVSDHALVERTRPGVIHVMGDALGCRRRLMGSGFVAAPDYVVTNAHVVAGTDRVRLDTVLGVRDSDVVYYNPELDIAVLHSPGLGLPALPWAQDEATTGQDAVVMGFPQSGPFEAAPARVRNSLTIAGPDIYATGRYERQAYTVRGSIREGNSGGPMLNMDGEVLGVVFGASVDHTDTGYALTAREVQNRIGDVTDLTQPVDTQGCVAR